MIAWLAALAVAQVPYRTDTGVDHLPRGARAVGRELVSEALALGAPVAYDAALSRVAARVAAAIARGETVPPGTLQDWAADEGYPQLIDAIDVETIARGKRPAPVLGQWAVQNLVGTTALTRLGVGIARAGPQTVVVRAAGKDRLGLDAPLGPDGGDAVLRPLLPCARVGVIHVGPDGTSEPVDQVDGGRVVLPVRALGWHEVVCVDGGRLETLGLVRVGPADRPDGPAPADPRGAVADGAEQLRTALGLGPLELVDGAEPCGAFPDQLGGVEVTRDQHCSSVPLRGLVGDPWDIVRRRPMLLRTLADPEVAVSQIGVSEDALVLRTAGRFERLTSAGAREALEARLGSRWPGIEIVREPVVEEILARWIADAEPLAPLGFEARAAELSDFAAGWTTEEHFLRALITAQTLDGILGSLPPPDAIAASRAAVAIEPGTGSRGEPTYFAAIALAIP